MEGAPHHVSNVAQGCFHAPSAVPDKKSSTLEGEKERQCQTVQAKNSLCSRGEDPNASCHRATANGAGSDAERAPVAAKVVPTRDQGCVAGSLHADDADGPVLPRLGVNHNRGLYLCKMLRGLFACHLLDNHVDCWSALGLFEELHHLCVMLCLGHL